MNNKTQVMPLALPPVPGSARHMLDELLQVRGLMPLLMKQRGRECWTPEDRAEVRVHLRRISRVTPWLILLALPGSFVLLPAEASEMYAPEVFGRSDGGEFRVVP